MKISNLIGNKCPVVYLSVFSADELFYAEWEKNMSIRGTNFNSKFAGPKMIWKTIHRCILYSKSNFIWYVKGIYDTKYQNWDIMLEDSYGIPILNENFDIEKCIYSKQTNGN